MTRRSPRLRVGFDAGALVFPAGGVRRYTRELFSALPALAPDLDFVAIDPPAAVELPPGTRPGPLVTALPTNLARAAIGLPWAVRHARLDVFHAPAYTAPLMGQTPTIVTIHDVSYARRPEFYAYRLDPIRQWFYRRSARNAVGVITDSQFSRREITAAYGIGESRIAVVPLGVGSPFGPRLGLGNPDQPTRVRTPFVLHVGDLHPRRDVATALRAVVELRRRGEAKQPPLQLVCAGGDCGTADSLRAIGVDAGMPDALVLLGSVGETELVSLYQNAVALVYPSLYEGFGLPVLEAMACGLPVVAANAGSVPEVLGDAGILVAGGDARGMAEAVVALQTHAEQGAELCSRGLKRAAGFSWEQTARLTLDVYRACLPAPSQTQPTGTP